MSNTQKTTNSPEQTVVIFRKWRKSEGGYIIALFPYDPGCSLYTCNSFEHIGQHGAACPEGVIQRTYPAKPEEYAELKRELESEPYNYVLKARSRIPADAMESRRQQIAEMMRRKAATHADTQKMADCG